MAEGFLQAAGGDFLDIAIAGSTPAEHVHPLAIMVMAETMEERLNAFSENPGRNKARSKHTLPGEKMASAHRKSDRLPTAFAMADSSRLADEVA